MNIKDYSKTNPIFFLIQMKSTILCIKVAPSLFLTNKILQIIDKSDLLFGSKREVVAEPARHAGRHRGELLGVLHAEYWDQVDNQTCRFEDII